MWVLTCQDENYNGGTSCVNSTFVESQGLLPPLSLEDGMQISALIIGAWGLAYVIRMLGRFLWSRF